MFLKVKGLKYSFENSNIIKDVTFNLKKGEKILISGANGSGKSTLLKLIAGIKKADGVEFNGKRIGFVFQNPEDQFIYEKVSEELAFGLENQGIPREEMENRIYSTLKKLNILELKNRDINTLSGGQKQKVAIASQLILNVDLLILDEITSMLDPKSTKEVHDVIKNLENVSIIKVSHDKKEVNMMDKILIFDDGVIKEEITPFEFFKRDDLLAMVRMNGIGE